MTLDDGVVGNSLEKYKNILLTGALCCQETVNMCRHRQCCGSGMFIPDPAFSILYPGSNNKKEEGQKICCLIFFVAINFTKLKIILFLTGTERNGS
jgi:hypothetical protein